MPWLNSKRRSHINFAANKAQALAEKKAKEALNKLVECEKAKKSIELTMAGFIIKDDNCVSLEVMGKLLCGMYNG